MEFQNDFDVKAPLERVWDTMLDVERVAPCVPGAQVLERTGDDWYKVGIKVKVGPVQMQYRGEVEIVERTTPLTARSCPRARARRAGRERPMPTCACICRATATRPTVR